jgi:hypothetical protein
VRLRPERNRSLRALLITEHCVHRSLQCRQVIPDSEPYCFEIDSEVTVNQSVSHAGDFLPSDFWLTGLCFAGNVLDGFTDDLELTNNRVMDHRPREELLECNPRCVVRDFSIAPRTWERKRLSLFMIEKNYHLRLDRFLQEGVQGSFGYQVHLLAD